MRITTEEFFDFGSLIVFDATHLPYGCAVWPAFWTKGPKWPDDGEIGMFYIRLAPTRLNGNAPMRLAADIVEGINLMNYNQMAVHTTDGCITTSQIQQTGQLGATNCSDGSGCTVHETKPNSFGAGFASAGGGVWATQFDVSGIYIWFWSVSVLSLWARLPVA